MLCFSRSILLRVSKLFPHPRNYTIDISRFIRKDVPSERLYKGFGQRIINFYQMSNKCKTFNKEVNMTERLEINYALPQSQKTLHVTSLHLLPKCLECDRIPPLGTLRNIRHLQKLNMRHPEPL
jgi:hypothetical protein